ncbi:MAG TPA: MerR family transcriptional regulator [Ureibacillus sp.]|nr:MerR family transcriptional regulator [Ureibacillus sp.]
MSDSEWITVSEASKQLNIPAESLRRYIRSHSVHLKVKKLGKKYFIHDDSMTVIRRIRALYEQNKSVEEVEEALSASGVPMTFTVTNDDDSMMTVNVADELEQIKKELYEQKEFNRSLVHEFKNLLQEFQKQGEQLSQIVDVVNKDKKLLEENRDLLESIVNNQQAESEVATAEQKVEKKQSFFARWLGK